MYTLVVVRYPFTQVAAVVVCLWALLSAAAALRNAAMRADDPLTSLEAEFRTLAHAVPPAEVVGFLEYGVDDGSSDHVMVYYAAQYALAPRVVQKRTDLEFLLVARDAMGPGADERLAGFVPIASSKGGHRLYQRRAK